MIDKIIDYSVRNKLLVLIFVIGIVSWGIYSLLRIPIDAVPDITNNQVQILTTSRNLSTQDMEQFITYPIELEMANLPGLVEIRSVTKFGLSVVTVVFEDDMGTYLPRQLIAEKIKTASEQIPEGFGSPEMGPISTGLGEIYQYVVDVEPEFKEHYSAMDLRTIQDWVIKRQLSGIPGVVEINTWGGQLKQYEVAVNPGKLRSMNIAITEVFDALETNNSISGAGYIEKNNRSYFIRGEGLVTSVEDIENIVVLNVDGIPVHIRDIAQVKYGYAPRFGAITGNGEGEKVMGQVMLLKDANSNEVLKLLEERVASIQENLPEGVYINPFLDRRELIDKTTATVTENLVLGALIVIVIVVLLLGNLRAGLLIASIIPLSLLFAISLMNYFGISANLMSLGAIDFGIIIDGAIIIVEFVLLKLTLRKSEMDEVSGKEYQALLDENARDGSSNMMRSAIFGQLIILIVFIPILTLTGIEGKMFKPMALTFSFALIGAMILCLTYIPAMAALVLRPQDVSTGAWTNKVSQFLQNVYEPIFYWSNRFRRSVVLGAIFILAISFYTFSQMGGEFVPQLDEGDIAIQPNIPTGTSLDQTIKMATQMESILLELEEVDQVVCRIGAAEVPTDPMNMEEIDVMVKLHPRSEWKVTNLKDELIQIMDEKLSIIPGVEYEFTQPIEMRFNELITGVRADVAIKLYGEDLDLIAVKGQEIKSLISNVEGAADITVEKTVGLPQMLVKYNRQKIARYGLNIEEINRVVQMNFSGVASGKVYEGERRFDLVVRLKERERKGIEDLRHLFIELPNGNQIPLNEVASVDYTKGPAKISRDNTKRRVTVGVNVRDRDMESVVADIKEILDNQLDLPPGYYINYGGQFENLKQAKNRLMFAVPLALVLIFILLYVAFGSIQDAVLVYTAIPLAAVGGIWLLWLRDLPFSISAGVGFIALFGIATLNGIVLIEHFKELKSSGMKNMEELVKIGTQKRIRPVILTALAAALGFFPMAISTSAGAEVQRPLATVVIGGLVTSTILTLVLLPLLYQLKERIASRKMKSLAILLGFLTLGGGIQAQPTALSLDDMLRIAMENNPSIKASSLQVEQLEALKKTGLDFGPTELGYNYGQINSTMMDYSIEVNQYFKFPTSYARSSQLKKEEVVLGEINEEISKSELELRIRLEYVRLLYRKTRLEMIADLDTNYAKLEERVKKGYKLGEIKQLELMSILSIGQRIHIELQKLKMDVQQSEMELQQLMMVDYQITSTDSVIYKSPLLFQDSSIINNARMKYLDQSVVVADKNHQIQKNEFAPNIKVGYFNQQIDGLEGLDGLQFGVSFPLFFWAQQGNTQSAKIQTAITQQEAADYRMNLTIEIAKLLNEIEKQDLTLAFFSEVGADLSNRLIMTSAREYDAGEIGYIEFTAGLKEAFTLRDEYYNSLYEYNLSVIRLNFLAGYYN